ncbi:hypothetical protein N7462_008130 [Penicillium macrosclerotiorum]|uniref:uncharacterized protein n=1 Tax=Penicillium macrosclerotiorum TaxID=303699 RepID=UPI0025490254|nr:uncharacterized protein N7462_008130 [Penicillium macrosclerotiorum]KAJ5679886.1 hypothetical protein N7462_008130 [Penicillium macrosclerotiorum]
MNSIRVAIERSLINITYADLERHPQAPVKEPIATRTANTSDDLSHIQIGAHTTISEVRLNVLTHQFDPSGFAFPYRGRGPVWADGSCAIDVSVVLGMLSDAGCTVVDRENDADKAFGEIERAFIQVTNMNWDAFNDEVSIQLRHSFYKLLCDNCPSIEINEPIPIWTVWAESTRSFKQFTFGYIEAPIEQCVHCGNTIKDVKRGTGHTIIPPWKANDEKGVTVPELVERCWNSEPKHIICEGCGSHTGPTVIRAVEKLPLRLVVSTSAGFLVLNHTQDLVFNYIDTEGFTRTATYRWLGGAYYRNNHTRVYWTDAERGGFDTGYIRKYDSMDAAGTIIGGLPPYAQDERIHPDWTEKGIPIIIYERVMNPSTDVLHAAQQSVSDMMNMVSEGKYVLNEHYPWLPTPPVPRRPEPRILPDYGDRFVESSTSSGNLIYQTSDHAANGRPGVELTGDSKYAVARWIAEKIIDIDGLSSDSAGNMSMKRRASQLGLLEDPPFEQAKKCSKIFTSLLDDPSSLRDCPEVWEGSVPPTSGGMMRFPKLSVPLSSKRDRSKGSSLWEYFQTAKEISGSKNPSKSGAAGVVNWVSMNQAICNTRRPPYCVYPIPVALIKKAMKERASELQEEQQELYGRRKRAQMEGTKDEGTSPIRKRRIRA